MKGALFVVCVLLSGCGLHGLHRRGWFARANHQAAISTVVLRRDNAALSRQTDRSFAILAHEVSE